MARRSAAWPNYVTTKRTRLLRCRAQQLLRAGYDLALGAPRRKLGFPDFKGIATRIAGIVGKVARVAVGQRQQDGAALAKALAQVAVNKGSHLAGNTDQVHRANAEVGNPHGAQ